jgi:predicted enzyme related to lactoylglutathione lyase
MLHLGDDVVAALYEQPREQSDSGVPPVWLSYVTVASADETAARVSELGGAVHIGPFDVMDAGRMAIFADPTGAMLAIWEPRGSIGAERVNDHGCLTWNELTTNDPDAAREFHSALFGWTFEAVDSAGPRYWIIGHPGAAANRNGGMRELMPDELAAGVPPHWLPYFAVESTDAAVEQAQGAGARVLAGPMDVPAGRIAALMDPQGAAFAVFAGPLD